MFHNNDLGILLLRLFVGIRLFYGVIDNVVSSEDMDHFADFLRNHHFLMPELSAYASVYAQLICSICIILGYKIRLASGVMVINFLIAILFVHIPIGDSFEGMTPPLAMLFGSLLFVLTGPGRWSVERKRLPF